MKRRSTLSEKWDAWAGGTEELRRIGRLLEDASGKHPDVGQTTVNATLKEGTDEYVGSVDEVLDVLDRRRLESLVYRVTSKVSVLDDSVVIRFDPGPFGGVTLVITSEHTDWAKSVLVSVSDEVRKGEPRWARLNSVNGRGLLTGAVGLMAFVSAFYALHSLGVSIVFRAVLAGVCAAIVEFPLMHPRSYRWLMPSFEVTGADGSSSGTRRLVALVLVLVQIPIGIAINVITR